MNKPLATLGAAAAGALAMYYLDPELGARRRALLADLVREGLPGEGRGRGRRRLARRALPAAAAGLDPRSDAELRDRIRAALDRMVSHPRALHVRVEEGVVHLSGRLLASEREGVLAQVRQLAGVHKLADATTAHTDPGEIARGTPPVSVPATTS
jgi:hypothetical protein